jgi:glycosyltransferase involved in cell wall biosynthesis
MSRVDVIVPCYKYAHFLQECVESVLSQSLTDVRVLIIDDASPDHTPEVAAALAARDKRVEYRRHPVNRGHIATYNEGLDWAGADYTLLLSADDLLTPGALLRAVRLMDAHPEVGLAHGRGIEFQTEPPLSGAQTDSEECRWRILTGPEFLESCCARGTSFVSTPTAVVRTRLQKELGGYRKELPHAGDVEMWMRFATCSSIGSLDSDQAYYRIHSCNMSLYYYMNINSNRLNIAMGDLQQRKAAFEFLFRDHGHRIADRERLQQLAIKCIARDALVGANTAFEYGDLSGCQELLDFALDIYPELGSQPECSRLRWKHRMGPRVWSALLPIIDCLRFCTNRPLH